MADDIKITNSNPSAPQGGSPQGNQPAGAGQPAGDTGTTGQPQLNPVIDLSGADQKPQASQTGAQTPAAGQASTAAAPAPRKQRASNVMLEGEEDQMAAPQDKYSIPTMVKEKFPDLIDLIKQTESMNEEEREYWFQILPIMTEEQIKKFRDILVNEKEQLTRLDKEYETELTKLNEKHLIEWKEFETKEKRKALTTAEQAAQQNEQAEEEALLKRLSQI